MMLSLPRLGLDLGRAAARKRIPIIILRTCRPYSVKPASKSNITTEESTSETLPAFDYKSFKFSKSPCPEWQYGQGMQLPPSGLSEQETELWRLKEKEERTVLDLSEMPSKDVYQLLTSAIVPRPIAFVSTLSKDGVSNLAPFSYFSMMSHNPPLLTVSFSLTTRRPKDTRENILATKEFTVNIISEPFVEAANSTSVESSAEMDEWVLAGLTRRQSVLVKPPIVAESAVSMECELYSHQDIYALSQPPSSHVSSSSSSSPSGTGAGNGTSAKDSEPTATLVLGLIKRVHVREGFLIQDESGMKIDPARLRAMSRLGGTTYSRVVEGFDIPRVSWKAVKGAYEELALESKK